MPKLGMQALRKDQVIKAMMFCIASEGIHKSTMQKIAVQAGITPSLIVHYFKDRNTLIYEVYKHLYHLMDGEIRQRVAQAITPQQKIFAICEAQISSAVLRQDLVVTWVTLYALLPEFPELRRLDRIYVCRMHSNLVFYMKKMDISHDLALQIAKEITALIDGLWVRNAGNSDISHGEIGDVVHGYLNRQLRHP